MFDKNAYYRVWRKKNPAKSRGYTAKWKARNPDKVAAKEKARYARKTSAHLRLSNVRRLYGLTAGQYNSMLGVQNGLCALCGMSNDGRALCVDHKHVDDYAKKPAHEKATLVRGLLCAGCNSILGFCGDDPEIVVRKARGLLKVATYLSS